MTQIETWDANTTTGLPASPKLVPFDLPAHAGHDALPWTGVESLCDQVGLHDPLPSTTSPPDDPLSTSQQEVEEKKMRERFLEGKREGFEEGCRAEREAQRAQIQADHIERKAELAHLLEQFESARTQYLQDIEPEVIQLALAVAARVIRREAQLDPLVLTGAVRIALGQLSSTTRVRLVVPKTDEDLWKETIEHLPQLAKRPEVVPEAALRTGDCRIETEMGSVDLSVGSQLTEIERALFEAEPSSGPTRLQRPAGKMDCREAER